MAEQPACTGQVAGSTPAVSITTGLRSVNGKHAPFVRPRCGFNSCRRLSPNISPWCSRQHGELQPRTPGFESWRACSNGLSRAGADRLSPGRGPCGASGSRPQHRSAHHDRDTSPACGPEQDGYRSERPAWPGGGVFESRPEDVRVLRSSGAHSWAFLSRTHTTASTTTTTERRCTCRT